MTDKQPEALRLADLLTDSHLPVHHKAAAELRQLYAENEDFRATCDHLTRENAEQIGEIVALKEQRDELLESLAKCRANFRRYEEATLKMAQAEDEERASLRTQRNELLSVTQGFRRKLATYVSVYPGDKELRKLLDDCDAAIAKATN